MKTIRFKSLIMAAVLTVAGLAAIPVKSLADEPVSTYGTEKYQRDNALIRDEIATVNMQKERISQLKAKCKKDKAAGREEAVIIDQRDLAKMKADLSRSQAYLAADKKNLVRDHRLAIRNSRDEIKKDQANLDKYKAKLNKDIALGNEAAIAADANKIAYYQSELKNDRAQVDREKNHLDADLTAINKELKKSPAKRQPVTTPSESETAYARTNGKLYK